MSHVVTAPADPIDGAIADLRRSHPDDVTFVTEALRASDALTSAALHVLAARGGLESSGLSTEIVLQLDARRTGSEARALTHIAATLRAMPYLARAFSEGVVSFGQVRAICSSVKHVDATGRTRVDAVISARARELADADPDVLVARVDDLVADLRADLELAREQRAIESSFLAIQPRLYGGGSFYGEADTESFATLLEAIDSAAPAPVDPDEPGAPTRAQQRFEGLLSICEDSLSGASGGSTRPRARLIASVDIDALGHVTPARALRSMPGRLGRLTPLATDVLACDADVVPVIFEGARPIAVGDEHAVIPPKVRTALIARDRGCRFPGCGAPASWCDGHHIIWRSDRGRTSVDNLVLLCRKHHRAMHLHRWRIEMRNDGDIEFTRGARRYTSPSRRRPSRE